MKKLALIGIAGGTGLVLLGVIARSPGQAAISNAVIAAGILIILFVVVLSVILRFKGPSGS